jgi:uncharacterized membrane protein
MRSKIITRSGSRFEALDAFRGLAMVWMTAFHFSFDLNQFGFIQQDFYHDPLWTWQRTFILSLFLFCAGTGQAMAVAQGQSWPRFWVRWVQVAACALLVTAGSWWMYPQSFIYFGVLQGIALMLIIVRLTAHWGAWLWFLGGVVVAIKYIAVYAISTGASAELIHIFNSPALNWMGVITRKPITEDYVPLLPWLGVMWWGAAAGAWWSRPGGHRLLGAIPPLWQPLVLIGRWSLSYYMVHQPIMICGLMALRACLA